MAQRNVYALMIGIDNYPIQHHKLNGCVNDMEAMKAYLEGRFDASQFNLQIKALKNEEAKRDVIIDGFLNHLTQAKEDDIVFIHYSGHGSQVPAPKEFWHSEPDKLIETMVCWDSRIEGGYDLTSKELSYLIWKVAQSNPHIVMLYDCCHSGSITRDADSETMSRMAEQGNAEKPLDQYIGYQDYIFDPETGRLDPPVGRHILLAAARDNETAKEVKTAGTSGGVFTNSLLNALKESKGNLSYQDLMTRVQTKVYNSVSEQHPQLEAISEVDKIKSFLDGAILPKPDYYTIVNDATEGWVIDAGGLHGIPVPSAGKTTKLALFDEAASPEDLANIDKAIGTVEVIDVLPEKSVVKLEGVDTNATDKVYKAKITEIPVPALQLHIDVDGEEEGVKFAKSVLENTESLYLQLTDDIKNAKYRVLAKNNEYYVTYPSEEKPLFKRIKGYSQESAQLLFQRLEHIARWESTYALSNPDTAIEDSEIGIEFTEVQELNRRGGVVKEEAKDTSGPVTLEYKFDSRKDRWSPPRYRMKVKNNGADTLYFAVLLINYDFSIQNSLLPIQRLAPGEEVYVKYKPAKQDTFFDAIPSVVSSAYSSWGITDANTMLKVLVSTVEFNTATYNLDGLELDRKEVTKRAAFDDFEDDFAGGNFADWTVKDVHITTIRPLDSMDLAEGDVEIQGVKIKGHAGLKAKVNLSSQKEATRAAGDKTEEAIPSALSGNRQFESLALNDATGKSSPLSILELSDVTDTSVVNENAPLELELNAHLADNEMILPIGYDSDTGTFIPLGSSSQDENGQTQISIDQLPTPTPAGTRSLGGSIKILFQKVILNKIGYDYEYPILAEGIVSENGEEIKYNKDKEDIKQKVAKAERIVVFVHGIIGDTLDMTKSVRKGKIVRDGETKYMGDLYDLALTFDYENLNTRIQETGKIFKERLEAVGLGPNHGKTLHIVAHSMGGLVSRWMIEREGGHEMVNHLIQLGTPNGGSAWSDVYKWAKVALSFVMGKVSLGAMYMAPLSFLLKKVSKEAFVTLQQMNGQSDFYADLNGGNYDPKVPYTIICGDTSQIPRMQDEEVQSKMKKAIAKLGNDAQGKLINDLIFKSKNDIAVALDSIKAVPDNRNPAPKKIEVACDHMSYFCTDAGLNALTETVYEI